jgi:alginate O-acetyltransferase complex protein AlgI
VRAADFLPQLARPLRLNCDAHCVTLLCSGLVKKVLVADNLAPLVDEVLRAPEAHTSAAVRLAMLCFSAQVYCDFSGYTDIAIGVARMLGVVLPPNFRRPYFALNPGQFWRRWHISLSSWLRDYLYIPLGGNRGGLWRTARNLLLTMLLSGLWHGASWNFVLFGAWHGLLLAGHYLYERLLLPRRPGLLAFGASLPGRLLSWGLLMYCWVGGLVFFRVAEPRAMWTALHKFVVTQGGWSLGLPGRVDKELALIVLALFSLLHFIEHVWGLKARVERLPSAWLYLYVAVCVLLLAAFWPGRSEPFVYFQF